jgi:hypothetical protein
MGFIIKTPIADREIVFAESGETLTRPFFVRYTPSPQMRGVNALFDFNYFLSLELENKFKDFNLKELITEERPVLDEDGNDTGETQTRTYERTFQKKVMWDSSNPLTLQFNAAANQTYEQIKDIPQVAAMISLLGDISVRFFIATHFVGKELLEQQFGKGNVEIDFTI